MAMSTTGRAVCLALLSTLAWLFCCTPEGAARPSASSAWVLQKGRDIPRRTLRQPTLRMQGATLSGSTGCNNYTATMMRRRGKRVAIEWVALTRKLCAAERNRTETAFVRALGQTAYLRRKGRTLTFLSGKGRPLLVWQRRRSV
jgi:heat shock protein HslJ